MNETTLAARGTTGPTAGALSAGLLALLALVATTAAAEPAGTYVVLEGFAQEDPYHEAAKLLAEHHGTTHVLRFDPLDPESVLGTLRELAPSHVAIVLKPEQIDVNSVRRILVMATKVDDDPFVDFDYGYVTGATPSEARSFVERIVNVAGKELPRKVGELAVWGDAGPSEASDGTYAIGPLVLPSRSLRCRKPAAAEREQPFLDENLKTLAGCGALLIGGHGMPAEIVSGPRAEDIDRLDLFPSVVFNYACYTGVTGRYPEDEFGDGKRTTRLKEIEAKRSFALAVLRRGAVGYVAYVNPRPAGPELSVDFERVLAGGTLGEVRRRDYDKIVLGYLGYGEKGIVAPPISDGSSMPMSKVDVVRHLMLDAATGGILFGDPASRPFAEGMEALPIKTACVLSESLLKLRLRLLAPAAYVWGADPFRRLSPNSMAMKVVDRVVLPVESGPIRFVRVDSATMGGQPLETLPVIFAEETDQGKRYLHVKVNFARGGMGDIDIALTAGLGR